MERSIFRWLLICPKGQESSTIGCLFFCIVDAQCPPTSSPPCCSFILISALCLLSWKSTWAKAKSLLQIPLDNCIRTKWPKIRNLMELTKSSLPSLHSKEVKDELESHTNKPGKTPPPLYLTEDRNSVSLPFKINCLFIINKRPSKTLHSDVQLPLKKIIMYLIPIHVQCNLSRTNASWLGWND